MFEGLPEGEYEFVKKGRSVKVPPAFKVETIQFTGVILSRVAL